VLYVIGMARMDVIFSSNVTRQKELWAGLGVEEHRERLAAIVSAREATRYIPGLKKGVLK